MNAGVPDRPTPPLLNFATNAWEKLKESTEAADVLNSSRMTPESAMATKAAGD